MTESSVIVFGVSHIELPVRDLARARQVYENVLGLPVQAEGNDWVDLDAGGATSLRLVHHSHASGHSAIRVQSSTVEATTSALCDAGCAVRRPLYRTKEELLAIVSDLDGHQLTVWRALTEDEFDYVPPLPKQMTWDPQAEELLKSLLKAVPALFRGMARRKVVPVVEELAQSSHFVTNEEVIRGYILASPKITRGRNRQPLIDHGIDVDRYQADWDAD